MFEESVEGFIARWRHVATTGQAFARAEGSPLLEVAIGDRVLQLFERTGPYAAPAGAVRLIVHAVTDSWRCDAVLAERSLAVIAPTRLRLQGVVSEREGPLVVVDAGIPVVVGLDARGVNVAWPEVGSWLSCETLAPAHGFVLPAVRVRTASTSPDEEV